MTSVDVVIVGAGAAGLAAARAAHERRLSFVLVEALDRIGGRAWTDSETFDVPWDWGCHWLHSGSINPMRELADQYDFEYLTSSPPRVTYDSNVRSSESARESIDASVERCYDQFLKAGLAGQDVGVADAVDETEPGFDVFLTSMGNEWSVDPMDVSALDASRYRDTDENWPVAEGYGTLVARHARGIPVDLGTIVTHVEWGRRLVRVVTNRGEISARTVLLTVSTAVLAEGRIAFGPILPAWKQAAFEAVPLGTANKATFEVPLGTLGFDCDTSALVPFAAGGLVFVQVHPFDFPLVSFYLSGPVAAELEATGHAETLDVCEETLRNVFGSSISTSIGTRAASAWGNVETIGGAYASARVGLADKRRDLMTPIDNQLFFAGEATHAEFFSTCHGAHLSGVVAIEAISTAFVS
ncbi:NAD(P)/FAD-dependent oxidoreductase [soil metagenome]